MLGFVVKFLDKLMKMLSIAVLDPLKFLVGKLTLLFRVYIAWVFGWLCVTDMVHWAGLTPNITMSKCDPLSHRKLRCCPDMYILWSSECDVLPPESGLVDS